MQPEIAVPPKRREAALVLAKRRLDELLTALRKARFFVFTRKYVLLVIAVGVKVLV